MGPIKVLVVDDSVFIRVSVTRLLESDPDIEVIDAAKDGKEAVEKVKRLRPDVVTMDVIMPVMDGLAALKQIMKDIPTPVVMLSSITRRGTRETIAALAYGAIDFIPKPLDVTTASAISRIRDELVQKIKTAAVSKVEVVTSKVKTEHLRQALQTPMIETPPGTPTPGAEKARQKSVIAIGASTGGPSALQIILSSLPLNFPLGVVVVQHISPGFTEALVERLNKLCALKIKIADDGDHIIPGTVLFAPAGKHLHVNSISDCLVTHISDEPLGQANIPSVDVAFSSAAKSCKANSCGVLLTGMGGDGAKGLKAIRDEGGLTIAQDEATSVIFGMARRAIELRAVEKILPLGKMTKAIIDFAKSRISWMEKAG